MAISNPVDIGSVATVANAATQAFNTTVIIPAGSKIQIEVGWFDAAATLSSVTGGSLTWTIDHQGKNGSVGCAIVSADAPAGLASGTTLTANYSAGTADRFMSGEYETGVQVGSGAAYGVVSQNQSVAAWSSTTTTVNPGDLLIGASHTSQASGSPTSTASGGNTEIHDITCADGDSFSTVYQLGTGAAIAGSGTWTGAGWTDRSAAVAYKVAPDAGSAKPVRIANPRVGPVVLRRLLAQKIRQFLPGAVAPSTTYTDSPTGTLTFTGSSTETHSHSSSPSGTLTLSGTRVEANLRSDSPSGTITLSGTRTESNVHAPAVSGSLTFSGSQAQAQSHSSSPSGTITFSGSQTQSQAHTVAVTGTITFSGTVVENFQPPGVPSGGNYRSQADEVRLLLMF